MRTITIQEEGLPPVGPTLHARAKSRFDLQDGCVLLGFLSLEGGVAAIYWPAALILAGATFYLWAFMIQRVKTYEETSARRSAHGSSRQ